MLPPKWLISVIAIIALILVSEGLSLPAIGVALMIAIASALSLERLARPSQSIRVSITKAVVGAFLISMFTFFSLDFYPFLLLIVQREYIEVNVLILSLTVVRITAAELTLLWFFGRRFRPVGLIASLLLFGPPLLTILEAAGIVTNLLVCLIRLLGVPELPNLLGAILIFLILAFLLDFSRLAALVILTRPRGRASKNRP